jgi:phosphoesterase RecJ-like protein
LSGREAVVSFIKEHDDFLIATHVGPDGDALGSSIALSLGLESLNKKNVLYCKDGVPEMYRFLPGGERVKDRIDPSAVRDGTLILLDCGSPERAALENVSFRRSAVMDHHETDFDFGNVKWVDPGMPATGLMVFELLKAMDITITPEIATNLYAAISIDTGTFRFPNTNSAVLRAAAELVDSGAEPGPIAESLYSIWSRQRFNLLCMNLRTIEIEDSISVTVISKDMFEATGTTQYDTENFVNFPLLMSDVRISAFIREADEGTWKVSLRSRGETNVAEVAERFQGGGHRNAAGCTVKGDFAFVKKKLMDELKDILVKD